MKSVLTFLTLSIIGFTIMFLALDYDKHVKTIDVNISAIQSMTIDETIATIEGEDVALTEATKLWWTEGKYETFTVEVNENVFGGKQYKVVKGNTHAEVFAKEFVQAFENEGLTMEIVNE